MKNYDRALEKELIKHGWIAKDRLVRFSVVLIETPACFMT